MHPSDDNDPELFSVGKRCAAAADLLLSRLEVATNAQSDMVECLEPTCGEYTAAIDKIHTAVDSVRRERLYEARDECGVHAKVMEAEVDALVITAKQLQACAAMCESGINGSGAALKLYTERLLVSFTSAVETTPASVHVTRSIAKDLLAGLSSLTVQTTPSYISIAYAITSCKIVKSHASFFAITSEQLTALNIASEHAVSDSVTVALAYCDAVLLTVYSGPPGSQIKNRTIAGAVSPSCVALVLSCMRAWPLKADVQIIGIRALSELSWKNFANIADMRSFGGFEVLFAAADMHVSSRDLQWRVCSLLTWVARSSEDWQESDDWRWQQPVGVNVRVVEVAARAIALHPDIAYYAISLLRYCS